MRVIASVDVDATDEVVIKDRSDIDTTCVSTGELLFSGYVDSDVTLYVRGEAPERAAFLRRLANAASNAAADLMAEVTA